MSGGSVYAADLGLNGPAHAASFMQRIQDYDGIGWLARRFLNPFTWLSLQFESETRIDRAAGDDRGSAADQGDDGSAQ